MCRFCREKLDQVSELDHCSRCSAIVATSGGRDSCDRCAAWHSRTLTVRSRYVYSGAIRKAIHLTKYQGERVRAGWIGRELVDVLDDRDHFDMVSPVPLAAGRQRSRGYNQSALIAASLAEQMSINYVDSVARTKETTPQVGLSAIDRYLNVRDAFAAATDVRGASILLIDDVITTGSTLDACAMTLERAGARSVTAATLASEVRSGD